MPLTHRLFLLVAIASLPALAIQAYNELDLRRSREAEVRALALRQAQLAASELDQIVGGIGSVLTAVAEVPAIRSLDRAECGAFLRDLQLEVPHLRSILVVDRQGEVACRDRLAQGQPNQAARPHVREALATGGFVVGELSPGLAPDRPVLPLARPLRDARDHIVGVIVAELDLDWLSRHLAGRGLPAGDSVTMADRRGYIVARAPLPERFVGTRIPPAYRHLVTAATPGAIELTSQDGTRRVLGYVPAAHRPVPGIYVSAGLAADQAFAAIDRATQRGMALIALGLVGALAAAWLVGHRVILRPMASLVTAARRWRGGDFAARVGLNGQTTEFVVLGQEFDHMADEIARREAERDRALQAAQESEARLRAVVESLPFEFWVIDASGRYVLQNPASRASWGDRIGLRPEETGTPPALLSAWLDNNRRALAGEVVRTEQSWREGDRMRHVEKIIAPILAGDRILGAVGLNIDVSERYEARERQRLLVAELNHRVRNMLATIGAIVRLTLTDGRPLEDARDALRDRLDALAGTYDLLTASHWRGALLSGIAGNELRPYGGRATIRGPDLMLTPQAAQTIGMILHELATNAAKYGAFSTNDGRVELGFAVEGSGQQARLCLNWREISGPAVRAPERRGLGRNVLEEAGVRQLRAEARIEFHPDGLRYRLAAPLAAVTDQRCDQS
jgi:PAS domain S-box-containing protein